METFLQLWPIAALFAHRPKYAIRILDEISGRIELEYPTFTKNEDPVIIYDCFQTMRNCDDLSASLDIHKCLEQVPRTIAFASSSLIVLWICKTMSLNSLLESNTRTASSTTVSIWEVASSRTTTWEPRRIALASATSCLSPALREPTALIGVSSPPMSFTSCVVPGLALR